MLLVKNFYKDLPVTKLTMTNVFLSFQMEPVLSLAAAMSVQSPFKPHARRDPQCQAALKELENDHGDPFTLLSAYRSVLHCLVSYVSVLLF